MFVRYISHRIYVFFSDQSANEVSLTRRSAKLFPGMVEEFDHGVEQFKANRQASCELDDEAGQPSS